MKPLGTKILVRDVKEDGVDKIGALTVRTKASGIITAESEQLRKVEILDISTESVAKYKKELGVDHPLKIGDICLCNTGGVNVDIEKGIWLCNEGLLDAIL